jgi:hypothetical protein
VNDGLANSLLLLLFLFCVASLATIFHIVNFPNMDSFSPSDPYVIFENHQQKQKCKSKTIQDDNNPKWNQNMQLCVFGLNDPLKVAVYDEDLVTSDDIIGFGTVDLSKLGNGEPQKQVVTLELKGKIVHGRTLLSPSRINVELTYSAITH